MKSSFASGLSAGNAKQTPGKDVHLQSIVRFSLLCATLAVPSNLLPLCLFDPVLAVPSGLSRHALLATTMAVLSGHLRVGLLGGALVVLNEGVRRVLTVVNGLLWLHMLDGKLTAL